MTIRKYLESIGATKTELSAKIVERMERAMLFDSDFEQFKPDTVVSMLDQASQALVEARDKALNSALDANQSYQQLHEEVQEAQTALTLLSDKVSEARAQMIEDYKLREACLAYAAILNATKDIFGAENLTSDVMIAAIQAGSCAARKSISVNKPEPEEPASPLTVWK